MAIAIISVMGAGLLGFLGILVQHLLKQNAQRHDEHVDAMGAIHEQGLRTVELIQQSALAAREHADELHREAMSAIAAQGLRTDELHREAVSAIAAQGLRMDELHREAMSAIAALDREHREHREKLHTETTAQIAALSERTAVLETRADRE